MKRYIDSNLLQCYYNLKNQNINFNELKHIININNKYAEGNYTNHWIFVLENVYHGYKYFLMADMANCPQYLTGYIELENKLNENQTIEAPISITFNGIGMRGRYCIGIDQNHIWNDNAENHLDIHHCIGELEEIIDWLIINHYE